MEDGKHSVLILDYIVFVAVLLISLTIGIVFSCRQRTSEEYIHGSHSIGLLPVSASLTVSFISAITVQGMPAEVYLYGLDYLFTLFFPPGVMLVIFTFLPIYYEMQCSSMFQYLEERFQSKRLRVLANIMSLIAGVLYAGITMFGPAAAAETLTGIPTIYNIIAMAVVCTIYTSIGGIRAVIWADVFQAAIMLTGILTILITGIRHVGLRSIWYELERRGHTTLNFSPDITQRGSVWIFSIGSMVLNYQLLINQSAMIRLNSLPTLRQAKIAIVLTNLGFFILQGLSMLVGIVTFAYYSQLGCGPLGSEKVYSPNQIVPEFAKEINIPGVTGIFLAAVVSSSLSSVSSVQNSFATTLWKDILCNFFSDMTEFQTTFILKLLSILCGILSMAIAITAMYLGGTLSIASSITQGFVIAPLLGMFIVGASFNFVSGLAAFIGCICGMGFCLWLSIGQLLYGTLWERPHLINDSCGITNPNNMSIYGNWTTQINDGYTIHTPDYNVYADETRVYEEENNISLSLSKFYSITSFAFPTIGSGVTIIVALLLSLIPYFRHKKHVEPRLLFPFVRRFGRKYDEKELVANEKNETLLMT